MKNPTRKEIEKIVSIALKEDIGSGDITTDNIMEQDRFITGKFIAKEGGVIAGLEVARITFELLDSQIQLSEIIGDGGEVNPGDVFATIAGSARAILRGERVALNFLQRMSGIATLTRAVVKRISGTQATLLDTRKTAPGLRLLDKWAVRLGGGQNHRMGLYDMVLIKENHITFAGGILPAVKRIKQKISKKILIEVEVKNLAELEETLQAGVDRILLDNMEIDQIKQAVEIAGNQVALEVSGNVNLNNVEQIAATGVHFISMGMLTHSVRALDLSLILE
ncbi:MAG: carboxylating nicotinate-nucleotide diphosphorylase [Calditrichia bacterium]